nr:phospholipase-like protein [Tanacetum cinerariifolium]
DYLREEELRLCLEDEEMLRCEHEKLIVKENRFRLDEANSHDKNILAKLAPAKRNQFGSSSEKLNSKDISQVLHSMDTVWLSDDIERFLGQIGHVKCKFPWNDDYTIDRNFCMKLVYLDPARKGWLTEKHIDLWVDYMWHVRTEYANWAMVSCYFIQLLLQKGMPLFYANEERYTTPWSEVDQSSPASDY